MVERGVKSRLWVMMLRSDEVIKTNDMPLVFGYVQAAIYLFCANAKPKYPLPSHIPGT